MKYATQAVCLLIGAVAGWAAASFAARPDAADGAVPADWVARIGADYIDVAALRAEMERRGGRQPGQFQTLEQKQALLDDMLLQRALIDAARRAGVDREPETRRSIEQLLTSRYLQDTLRREQQQVQIDSAEIAAYYEQHADSYTVPARRRIAMLRIGVDAAAGDDAWARAEERASEALAKARALPAGTPHFGALARDYSNDQASRYRGGVIGWLTEGRSADYRHDRVVLEQAFALQAPGEISAPLRGADGVYLVRLVERQEAQPRGLEQLRAGIEQRLTQDRYQLLERRFREATLAAVDVERDPVRLAAVAPIGPPATDSVPQPPALPGEQEAQP